LQVPPPDPEIRRFGYEVGGVKTLKGNIIGVKWVSKGSQPARGGGGPARPLRASQKLP
jgi:hypothetical protein